MFSRFRVKGRSMEPSFHEGDFVIVRKFGEPRVGDVVVAEYKGRQVLKRISDIANDKYFLRGDNQVDGKVFSVKREAIIGKVFLHIRKP